MHLVDPLRRDDIERARRVPPEERARQAIDMMRAGFALKRSALRARFPAESEPEIDTRFQRWLGTASTP
jgi:Rv0078B-related antitoxin